MRGLFNREIIDGVSGAINSVGNAVDNLITSDEEKGKISLELLELKSKIITTLVDAEQEIAEQRAKVIKSEAEGKSWLQRMWRPLTMVTFLGLIVLDMFEILTKDLPEQAWTLLSIGMGGYIVGRSAEKVVPKVMEAVKKQ